MPSLANVATALPESRFSSDVHYFSTVSSTNHVARDLGRLGEPDGTVVVAEEQTEGRGRRHRRWESPAGAGLYVSLLLRPEFPAAETGSAVQLVAGIATAETLNEFLPNKTVLRWPNDCFVLDRKVAGVLVEAMRMMSAAAKDGLSPESVAGSVSVQTETGLVEGVANGLTDAGHLIVGTDDGTHEISVGEVIRLKSL